MTTEFLALANVWLFTRLVCLFRDDAASGRVWRLKAGIELIALGVLYSCGWVWGLVAAMIVALNLAGIWAERRARRKDFMRLLLGALGLAAWSVASSPRLGLTFRPELGEWSLRLGHWTTLAPFLHALGSARLQLMLFGLLFSANEANLLIRAAFDWLNLKPRMRADSPGAMELDVGEYNRGRVIGLLERSLIYFFVLNGQFGVIGFTLAAKAFTRFKELDDRRFAEYVLIGTLLSSCLAVATGVVVKWLLTRT